MCKETTRSHAENHMTITEGNMLGAHKGLGIVFFAPARVENHVLGGVSRRDFCNIVGKS